MGLDVTFYESVDGNKGKELASFRKPWQFFIGWYVCSKDLRIEDHGEISIEELAECANIAMDTGCSEFKITKVELASALAFSIENKDKPWAREFGFYECRKEEYIEKIKDLIENGPDEMIIDYCN